MRWLSKSKTSPGSISTREGGREVVIDDLEVTEVCIRPAVDDVFVHGFDMTARHDVERAVVEGGIGRRDPHAHDRTAPG